MKGGRGEDPRGDRSVKCGGESFLLQLSDVPTDYICSPSSVTPQARKKGAFKQQHLQAAGRLSVLTQTRKTESFGGIHPERHPRRRVNHSPGLPGKYLKIPGYERNAWECSWMEFSCRSETRRCTKSTKLWRKRRWMAGARIRPQAPQEIFFMRNFTI